MILAEKDVDFGTRNGENALRGGARQRYISRWTAPVWCPGGRWGPRRVRTGECRMTIRSEELYSALIREAAKGQPGQRLRPGCAGTAIYRFGRRKLTVNWEMRPNAVWRFGRVFFRCCRCGRLCARLYLPLEDSDFRCRQCWGLTYSSKTLQNYKDSIWGRGPFARLFGTTQRAWAYMTTDERRKERKEAAQKRWRARSRYARKLVRARSVAV